MGGKGKIGGGWERGKVSNGLGKGGKQEITGARVGGRVPGKVSWKGTQTGLERNSGEQHGRRTQKPGHWVGVQNNQARGEQRGEHRGKKARKEVWSTINGGYICEGREKSNTHWADWKTEQERNLDTLPFVGKGTKILDSGTCRRGKNVGQGRGND